MSRVWGLDVSGTEREILLVMTDHADDFGNNARPSISYIAWKVGCDARTVTRHIKAMRLKKALLLVKAAAAHAPSVYRVNLTAYPTKAEFVPKGDAYHDSKSPARGDILSPDILSPDNLSPDNSLSPKPPIKNNNNNNAPVVGNKIPEMQAQWHKELEQLTGGYMGGAEEFKALVEAWQKFPDQRRHDEAKRQTSQARSRTARVYLKAFLTFNPDWKPPAQTTYPKQTYSRNNQRSAPEPYIKPTDAERAQFKRELAERLAARQVGQSAGVT